MIGRMEMSGSEWLLAGVVVGLVIILAILICYLVGIPRDITGLVSAVSGIGAMYGILVLKNSNENS
jgi:predicted RND superfamily exporter protein